MTSSDPQPDEGKEEGKAEKDGEKTETESKGTTGTPPGATTSRAPRRATRPRPAARRPPVRPARRPPSANRVPVAVLGGLSVAVAVVAVVAFSRSPQRAGDPGGGTASSVPTTLALTTFRDRETGLEVRYPKEWQRLQSADPNVRLAVLIGGDNAFSVRVQRFEQPTTSENIENIKAFTDGVVGSNPTAKVLQQKAVTIDGMPGYFYLYTYTDESTGRDGVHAHYFLFRGRKANQIVFQATPDDFERLAPVFDQIIEGFRSSPDA